MPHHLPTRPHLITLLKRDIQAVVYPIQILGFLLLMVSKFYYLWTHKYHMYFLLFLGWKRELVYRNNTTNLKADVYYYSPDNTKFRSLREIVSFLRFSNNDTLTRNNFSFSSNTIGMNNETEEWTRNAYLYVRKVRSIYIL